MKVLLIEIMLLRLAF